MGSNNNRLYVDIMSISHEVTGSCNFCVVKFPNRQTIKFAVDCGLFQEKDYFDLNKDFPFLENELDFVLITHNHIDHIGRLPLLLKNGFCNKIYTTNPTKKLMPYALYDSYRVLRDTAKRKNKKKLYSEKDVGNTIISLNSSQYGITERINDNIKVTFFENGHLVGAAIILVQIQYPGYDDINLLFTGDYCENNIFFDVTPLPEWVKKLPITIIQESTYGYMETSDVEKVFWNNIEKAAYEGNTIICPVFSLGRSQEIAYELKCMQQEKLLNTNIPIHMDGKLSIAYTKLFQKDSDLNIKEEMRDFLPQNFNFIDKANRSKILKNTESKIVLTSSGSGSYGPAQLYIPEYIKNKNALIHFTGYTPEGTLGNTLKETEIGEFVSVGGLVVEKRAQVEYTAEYSAHAKADEMIKFLKQFKNLKLVLINHGEVDTKKIFAKKVNREVNPKTVGILGRDYFFRINPYGLVKTLGTKFEL